LLDDLKAIEVMADADLALELVVLAENIELISAELTAETTHVTSRGSTWQVAAERAIAAIRARHKLCLGETNRRRIAASDARRQQEARAREEKAARLLVAATPAGGVARRAERAARHAATLAAGQTRHALFVRHAMRLLPKATADEIWAAVNAEAQATQNAGETTD
jgi:hypothetical protein